MVIALSASGLRKKAIGFCTYELLSKPIIVGKELKRFPRIDDFSSFICFEVETHLNPSPKGEVSYNDLDRAVVVRRSSIDDSQCKKRMRQRERQRERAVAASSPNAHQQVSLALSITHRRPTMEYNILELFNDARTRFSKAYSIWRLAFKRLPLENRSSRLLQSAGNPAFRRPAPQSANTIKWSSV